MTKRRQEAPPRNAFEKRMRQFSWTFLALLMLLVYLFLATATGLAAAPALALVFTLFAWATRLPPVAAYLLRGMAVALGCLTFALMLLIMVPLLNLILPTRLRAYKGSHYSLEVIPWVIHNGLFYIVRYSVLPFVTLTPYGIWFLKAMGMKIGRNTLINTEFISDPSFISIGDDSVVGGSVRIFAHYGSVGSLVIARVVVGHGVILGVGCCLMGDVVVGDGAVILPHSVLLPGSRVGAEEIWGGVPARPISREEMLDLNQLIRGEASVIPKIVPIEALKAR
jgi:acetyltransferase-like isoleucine patch superfamily enzyme